MIRAIAILLLLAVPALAQEGYLGKDHDRWHQEFYMGLMRPDTPHMSCCNLNDCRPTSGRMVDDHYEVKVDGRWVPVPSRKIIHKSAPDGGYHVCAGPFFDGKPENLLCVILPPEG